MTAPHVYVHVPFCARRCSYCDFAIAVRARTPVGDYVRGIERELASRFPPGGAWPVETLYLGGGTPSRLGADGVRELLDALRARITLAPGAEVTLEANPEDVTVDAVRAWRDAGIGRVSLGAQSFDDRVLAWMHRTHTAEGTRRAVEALREGGIERWSIDLIFALPESLERDWARDLEEALALDPGHVSLYGLTVEPRTPLGRWRDRGDVIESPEERYESEFLAAHDALARRGLEHYEVSNYARPGERSRHNSSYWTGASYVGLGPAAHGFGEGVRRWNEPAFARWLAVVDAGSDPVAGSEELDPENEAAERVYLGLRTDRGLDLEPGERALVEPWLRAGWATIEGERLRLTPSGWLRLDALAVALTRARSP
jgi:oxygen-independent coproporphyrinogen-3 oxidase